MVKRFKNINGFLLVICLFFCFMFNVDAASTAPSTFQVNGNDLEMLQGSNYLPGEDITLRFTYKETTSDQVVYCTEPDNDMPVSGNTETYSNPKKADAKFAYILKNGYPNKSITGNSKKDYFITGVAIWHFIPDHNHLYYFNFANGTYKGSDSDVARAVNSLIEGANNATYATPSLKFKSPSSTLTLTEDGNYYVSKDFSVTAVSVSGKYTASVVDAPSGTIIKDTSGNTKSDFATNEKFRVYIPSSAIDGLSASFTVKISAKGVVDTAYEYTPSNTANQKLITLYSEETDLTDTTTLNITKNTKVTISKKDITNGEEIPGAHLVITDSDGKVVEEWVSTGEPYVIPNLPLGTYTLTETIAPDGYILNEESVEFTLTDDGLETTVVMYNDYSGVIISKQDFTTSEEVPGATLEICKASLVSFGNYKLDTDSSGDCVIATLADGSSATWVSTSTPKKIVGLPVGAYYLVEHITPEGYDTAEKILFIINEDGSVTDANGKTFDNNKVIMKDKKIIQVPTGELLIALIVVIGAAAIFYVVYYYNKKNKKKN